MEHETTSGADGARPDVEQVCQLLAKLIEDNGSKPPAITAKWRTEARRLIDLDGKTVDTIERAIRWSQADPFWRGVILSMPTFREKYDQLRLAASRSNGAGHVPYTDPADQSAYDQPL